MDKSDKIEILKSVNRNFKSKRFHSLPLTVLTLNNMVSFFNNYFFIFLAILAGMAMPTQAVVNSKLATEVSSPVLAAFISFAVGTVALFVYILLTGIPLSQLAQSTNAPLIAWIGGFLGAFFVSVMATVVPRIGVALAFSFGNRRTNDYHAFD